MYLHCKKIYGVNLIVAKYVSIVPMDDMFADFRTGDVDDNVGGKGGVYNGTPEEGSTDGSVEQDFKTPVIQKIDEKTDELIFRGFKYNDCHFYINIEKEVSAIVLFLERLIGADMTGKSFRGTGKDYIFTSNFDFDQWFATGSSLVQDKIRDGSALKNQVTAAANSPEGMATIIGANNGRT